MKLSITNSISITIEKNFKCETERSLSNMYYERKTLKI